MNTPLRHLCMPRILNGSHSFYLCSSANGMNHTCLCLHSRSWYSFTDSGGMESWVDRLAGGRHHMHGGMSVLSSVTAIFFKFFSTCIFLETTRLFKLLFRVGAWSNHSISFVNYCWKPVELKFWSLLDFCISSTRTVPEAFCFKAVCACVCDYLLQFC